MAYTTNIPKSGDIPAQSRSLIETNFNTIDTVLAINHVGYNATGQGKHTKIQMPEESADPTTLVDEGAIYTKQGSVTAEAELCYRREDSGGAGGQVIEMTAYQAVSATNGWTILPSGLLVKWGLTSDFSQDDGASTFTWPTAASEPEFGVCYNVQVTPQYNNTTKGYVQLSRIVIFNTTTVQVQHTFTNSTTAKYRSYIYAIGTRKP